MIEFCNAKINLGLDIIKRRDDGYHNIVTAMIPISWGDILEIVPAKGATSTLTVTGRTINCPPEKNLVMKAFRALADEIDIPEVDIYLRKIVPDGAGLGGGSSDAAHMLLALNRLFSLNQSNDKLAEIAGRIGADCPFFIYNTPMLATGTGTTLNPINRLNLDGLSIVVVKPPVSVPTKEAYSGVTPREPDKRLIDRLSFPISEWKGTIKNDFEESIFPKHPLVAEIKESLYQIGAIYASMSGSGSAVYGIFKNLPSSFPSQWSNEGWAYWQGTLSAKC